jgi:probable F420-dependent oxidoreductase
MRADTIAAARQALGPIGLFLPNSPTAIPVREQRAAVRRLEQLGYRAAWNNEGIGGKDSFVQLGLLLAATERMVFGSCVANIWARQPEVAHGGAAMLADAYPDRFVLGLGVGYADQATRAGRSFTSPLSIMRDYLDRMSAPGQIPAPDVRYARILAALGPKMLALSGELADGALPSAAPVEFTAQARQTLGPDKLLVVGLTVAEDADSARQFLRWLLGHPGSRHAAVLRGLGYSAEDIAAVSDRVRDAVASYGDAEAVAAGARAHLAAGADHVVIIPVRFDFAAGVELLARLAPALTALR